MSRRRTLLFLAGALSSCLLGACGRKGDPELPEQREDSFPRKYPSGPPPQ